VSEFFENSAFLRLAKGKLAFSPNKLPRNPPFFKKTDTALFLSFYTEIIAVFAFFAVK
jgi:hypothetical protein